MIHIFIGTKAQLIKMGPVMRKLQDRNIDYNFIMSGQHHETMKGLCNNFGIKKPDTILYAGKDITSISQLILWTFRIIYKAITNKNTIFRKDNNGILLNHGDTFSTLTGSLIGKIIKLKVAHVESGLRSFNLAHPFPEEITRLIVFSLSDYYICPGQWALNNVKKYSGTHINSEHNTLYDAVEMAKNHIASDISIPNKKFAIVTIHRYENVGRLKTLNRIIELLEHISNRIHLLFILHPITHKKLSKYKLLDRLYENNIEVRQRYEYFDFVNLIHNSEFLISDGGSNQEECYYLNKPCLLMRNATERMEGVNQNVVISKYSLSVINDFLDNYKQYGSDFEKPALSPSDIVIESLIDYY